MHFSKINRESGSIYAYSIARSICCPEDALSGVGVRELAAALVDALVAVTVARVAGAGGAAAEAADRQ